jgi:hypothetical protein
MIRNRVRALLAATLVWAMATSPVAATGTSVEPLSAEWLTNITESAELTGPILVRGVLVDRQGRPSSGRVSVIAWPPPEVMARLEVGDAVKTATVAKATVGPDGTFVLRVDPTVPLAEYMTPDGTVNFEVFGETRDGWAFFSFPRTLESGPRSAWVDPQAPGPPGVALSNVLQVTLRPGPAAPRLQESTTAPLPALDKTCTTTVVATYNGRFGVIGEVYPGPNSRAQFHYSSGSTSHLGVGVSATGEFGTFSASGTAGVSTLSTITFPWQAANSRTVFQSTFGYQRVRDRLAGKAGCVDRGYRVRPHQWEGGAAWYTAATTPAANFCSPMPAGMTINKHTGTAVTFTNGLEISGLIGIDLSTRTGFSTQTRIVHEFFRAGQICGTNDFWERAARIVGR